MPVFQVSTKSRNGVMCTIPRSARSNTSSSQSLDAWSIAQTISATTAPKRVNGPHAYSRSTLLRRLRHRVPFAQRLGVARRDVRVVRVGADGQRDFPGARALLAFRTVRNDRDALHVIEPEGLGWSLAFDQ